MSENNLALVIKKDDIDGMAGNTIGNTKDKKRKGGRSVRIYPPIDRAVEKACIKNFSYLVNQVLAEKFGINPELIDAYHREVGDENE